ncbi:molybdopterin-dependent oxidoreductase [Nocardioides sp. J2M5]|uniref:molybdopterin-dependent oxidoreductase n=1 Tax=Nocardioides palaemonis TaxID=2829810 RepID=UPI001BA47408|nr:molybdopterin-dependent oxidoreductase [Nocardioides palaemonis]MBS2937487.1 molybdopterin-dependent oxidoreductase [Nocardioides palaemonis]
MASGEKRIGVCNLCEAICGLELTIEGRDVVGVRGNPADPLSRGHVCPKGVAIADVYADPDRLRRPVRRVGSGWEEIGWDEAFDLVADNLARVIEEHGDDALGVYLGNPNAHSLGSMTHGTAMFKSFRTRNRYSATSVDQLPHQLVGHLMFGHQLLLPVPDIDRTSFFLVVGANPMASNGSLMTVPDFPQRVRDLRARGGRMVVLDPRRTETAKVADEHHFVRPGTDAWVLLAMLHVLTAETPEPPAVAAYADGLAAVVDLVAPFTPERAEEVSGLPADDVRRLARALAAADGGVAYSRIGVSAGPWGTVCQWAVNCLNVLTGNLDRVGGAMFTSPAIDAVGTGLIGRGHHDAWRSRVRGLPETAGELPVSALREEIETPGEGQVRAMLTVAGNPVLSTPDGGRLDTALAGLDFMAAVDIYVNETTRHADVILPPTTALERDHYDLVFHLLAVRDTARFTPAVFEKEADQRHDWEIFREITLRTTARLSRKAPLKKRLVQRARLTASPTFLVGQLLRRGSSGVTLKKLRARPSGIDLGPLRAGQLPERLRTKDRRLDLAPDLVVADVRRLDAADVPTTDDLLLIGRRHKQDCNSWMHNSERLTRGRPRHQLLMNPADLAARDLVDGARVRVTSRVGSVEVEVAATDDLMPGVVSLPHGYGHAREGVLMGRSRDVPGVSVNDLTDPELLDVSGNAALNGVPVAVTAC